MVLLILLAIHILLSIIRYIVKNNKIVMLVERYGNLAISLIALFYNKLLLNRIWSRYLILSVVFSYAIYLISLFIVGTKFKKANLIFNDLKYLKGSLSQDFKRESIRNLYSSTYEELIYRGLIQFTIFYYTHNILVSISISCIWFAAIHYFKKMAIVQRIDIFVFSTFITLYFQITNDLIGSIIIHIIRNMLVIMQKYSDYTVQQKRFERIKLINKERKLNEKNVQV